MVSLEKLTHVGGSVEMVSLVVGFLERKVAVSGFKRKHNPHLCIRTPVSCKAPPVSPLIHPPLLSPIASPSLPTHLSLPSLSRLFAVTSLISCAQCFGFRSHLRCLPIQRSCAMMSWEVAQALSSGMAELPPPVCPRGPVGGCTAKDALAPAAHPRPLGSRNAAGLRQRGGLGSNLGDAPWPSAPKLCFCSQAQKQLVRCE